MTRPIGAKASGSGAGGISGTGVSPVREQRITRREHKVMFTRSAGIPLPIPLPGERGSETVARASRPCMSIINSPPSPPPGRRPHPPLYSSAFIPPA